MAEHQIGSILDLKNEYTHLPRKCTKPLRCAILTKSPLKATKKGFMFTMRLCDEDPSSNAKAVCFEKSLFDNFEPMKTYDMANLKIKKAYSNDKDMELLITPETQVKHVAHQFQIERSNFTIDQIVRGETQNIRFINVKAKILSVEDIVTVGQYPNQRKKRDILLADNTGEINLVLWEGRTEEFEYQDGDIVSIENAVVSSFNKTLYITTSSETAFELMDAEDLEINETKINARPKPQHVITTLEAPIQAFKEFKSLVKCVNCRSEIAQTPDETTGGSSTQIIKCNTCSATFLATIAPVINECKFLILDEWYLATTIVVHYILQRNVATHTTPTQEEIQLLMNSNFSLRIDQETKKIEYAAVLNEPGNYTDSPNDEEISCKKLKKD